MVNFWIEMLKLIKRRWYLIGTELNDTIIQQILDANIHTLKISVTNSINKGPYLLTTILADKNLLKMRYQEIYEMLRPGEPPTIEIATQILIIFSLFGHTICLMLEELK